MVEFTLYLHHGGKFVGEPKSRYIDRNICSRVYDEDRISYWCLMEEIKQLGYDEKVVQGIYFRKLSKGGYIFTLLHDDASTLDMIKHAVKAGVIEVYIEHYIDGTTLSNGESASSHIVSYHVGLGLDEQENRALGSETLVWSKNHIENEFETRMNHFQASTKKNDDWMANLKDVGTNIEEENVTAEGMDGSLSDDDDGVDLDAEMRAEISRADLGLQSDEDDELTNAIEKVRRWYAKGAACMEEETGYKEKGLVVVRCGKRKSETEHEEINERLEDGYDSEAMAKSDSGSFCSESDGKGGRIEVRRLPFWPRYNETSRSCHIELGMVFKHHIQFKKALIKFSIQNKHDFSFVKNDRTRVRAVCKEAGCPWMIFASLERKKHYFQVKSFNSEHKCNQVQNISRATSVWMADEVRDLVSWHPGIKPSYIQEHIEKNFTINFSIHQCRRTKLRIMKKLERDVEYEYAKLGDYAHAIMVVNPGSTIDIMTTAVGTGRMFKRIYICLAALKNGFLEGCRPYLGLDGCFLKGVVKGQLLTAVGKDANNQMFPLAWAVVEGENNDSWLWFLQHLKSDINTTDGKNWTFMSDQHKGLVFGVGQAFPQAEHRLCARHIYCNWSSKYRGEALKDAFHACAKATNEPDLKRNLEELEKLAPGSSSAAIRVNPTSWCRAYFQCSSSCDSVDNNCSEAFNFVLVGARSKPIISMLDEIREYVMLRQVRRRAWGSKWHGQYGNKVMAKLQKNIYDSYKWRAICNGDQGFEVKSYNSKYSVHLDIKSCECRAWQLSGIPCVHACKAIISNAEKPMDYMAKWYKNAMFMKAYAYSVGVMSGVDFWPATGFGDLKPPFDKAVPGRPKKARRRSKYEPKKTGSKLSKAGRKMTCKKCGLIGHNKRGCGIQYAGDAGPSRAEEYMQSQQAVNIGRETILGASGGLVDVPITAAHKGKNGGGGRGRGRGRHGRKIVGIGIYTDDSGTSILNPGLPSQQLI